MKKIKYTHPSACKYVPYKLYDLEEIKKEIESERVIREMFEPVGFEWDEETSKEEKVEQADIKDLKRKFNNKK